MRLAVPALLVLTLALPLASAENPFISIPTVDPTAPEGIATGLQGVATALADDTTGLALSVPDAMLNRCDVAGTTPGEVPECEGVFVIAEQIGGFPSIVAGHGGAALGVVAGGAGDAVADADAIVDTKGAEGAAVVASVSDILLPAASDAAGILLDAFEEHLCELSTDGDVPDCGDDSALSGVLGIAASAYGAVTGILIEVRPGPACESTVALVEDLAGDDTPIECSTLPDGGVIVGLIPVQP